MISGLPSESVSVSVSSPFGLPLLFIPSRRQKAQSIYSITAGLTSSFSSPKPVSLLSIPHPIAIPASIGFLFVGSDPEHALEAMKIWDFENRLDLLTLEGKGSFWTKTQFSPDGNLLGSMSLTGQINIWRAPSWEEIEEMEARHQLEDAEAEKERRSGSQ